MEIAISAAKGRLSALVKAAREGRQVVLTRHGRPVAEIRAIAPTAMPEERIREMTRISREAAESLRTGGETRTQPAARSADFLYGDDGMPE